jgi:hypothetical protein
VLRYRLVTGLGGARRLVPQSRGCAAAEHRPYEHSQHQLVNKHDPEHSDSPCGSGRPRTYLHYRGVQHKNPEQCEDSSGRRAFPDAPDRTNAAAADADQPAPAIARQSSAHFIHASAHC